MVNAGAAAHGGGHRLAIAQVGKHALHIKADQRPVIVFGAHHHPHLLALGEQAAD
jgi:hypothetical protein